MGMMVSWMLVAAAVGAFSITALSGCVLIPLLHRLHFGQTIRESGVLPLVTADRLCIHGREEKNVEKPLLGISDREMFAEGEYEMILHPDDC